MTIEEYRKYSNKIYSELAQHPLRREIQNNHACLKLKKIVKLGYLPSRLSQPYVARTSQNFAVSTLANCLEHACFNFTNEQLDACGIMPKEAEFLFGWLMPPDEKYSHIKTAERIKAIVQKAGLQIEEASNTKLNFNQWNVALYFRSDIADYHLLLYEGDNLWSAKSGFNGYEIEYYHSLPKVCRDKYHFYNCYTITNPYATEPCFKNRENSKSFASNRILESL